MWTVIVSDQRGQEIARQEWQQGSLSIGRDQGSQIVLPTKTASRKHARLDLVGGTPVVVDEGSANGTLVNGARISGPTRVDEKSRIDIGEFHLTLQRPGAEEDESEKTVMMRPSAFAPPPPPPPPRPAPQVASPPRPAMAPPPPRPVVPPPAAQAPPRPSAPAMPPPRPVAPAMPPPRQAAPAMPPPRPAAPAMPQMPQMPSMPAPAMPVAGEGDITSQFERHLASVRSYREESQANTLNKKGRLDAGWDKVVQSMRSLQTRLSADKRVLSFTISRDTREVAIKIADPGEKRGHRYFLLSRVHPEGKFPTLEAVWLREFGKDDAQFDDAQKAMDELMIRVAGSLA
jgi:hypothetical protein